MAMSSAKVVEDTEIEYMVIDSKSQVIIDGSIDRIQLKNSLGFYRIVVNITQFESTGQGKEVLLCFKIC